MVFLQQAQGVFEDYRAFAALRAASLRCSAVNFLARAGPPFTWGLTGFGGKRGPGGEGGVNPATDLRTSGPGVSPEVGAEPSESIRNEASE